MKKLFFSCAFVILIVFPVRIEDACGAAFVLVDSKPLNGQSVRVPDLLDREIYLKFNNPVDRAYEQYISIRLLGESGLICQWNTCGWIEYAENDTKVIWHPSESFINDFVKAGEHFEIRIGFTDLNTSYNLRDTQGNLLEVTRLDFSTDSCQPTVNISVSGTPHGICYLSVEPVTYFIPGDTINVTYGFANPTCGQQIAVEVKAWVTLPDQSLISLALVTPATFSMAPGYNISRVVSYTFSGQELPGIYPIGLRILDPVRGSHFSTAMTGFYFGACPQLAIF